MKEIDSNLVIEKFKEGLLLARAHYSEIGINKESEPSESIESIFHIDTQSFVREMEAINKVSTDDKRSGNRTCSTTLIVPGLNMQLFNDIAFLHDANQCTLRGYLLDDGTTVAKKREYGNVNKDKHRFEPIIDRAKFIEKYTEHFKTNPNAGGYNEVIANIYPESVLGITLTGDWIGKDDELDRKLRALCVKDQMQKLHGIDFPIFIYNKGKLEVFKPSKEELAEIANYIPRKIDAETKFPRFSQVYKGPDLAGSDKLTELYNSFLSQAGYEISISKPWTATADNLWRSPLDKEKLNEAIGLTQQLINALTAEKAQIQSKKLNNVRIAKLDNDIAKLINIKNDLTDFNNITNNKIREKIASISIVVRESKSSNIHKLKSLPLIGEIPPRSFLIRMRENVGNFLLGIRNRIKNSKKVTAEVESAAKPAEVIPPVQTSAAPFVKAEQVPYQLWSNTEDVATTQSKKPVEPEDKIEEKSKEKVDKSSRGQPIPSSLVSKRRQFFENSSQEPTVRPPAITHEMSMTVQKLKNQFEEKQNQNKSSHSQSPKTKP